MSYLVGQSNINVSSAVFNPPSSNWINYHDDDVGLKVYVSEKGSKDTKLKLNQLEALELWKHLDNYFGKR